jgi:hypothetical protein
MEKDFGIRTAIVKAYNSVGTKVQSFDLENTNSVPSAFISKEGKLNVSEALIANSLSEKFKINPTLVEVTIKDMKNDGILNIKHIHSLSGVDFPFIVLNDNTSTNEELDKFRDLFNDKAEVK